MKKFLKNLTAAAFSLVATTPLVQAHNLDTLATSIAYDKAYVQLLSNRAALNQPLVQVGDEFWLIIKTTPGPGTTTGVGGYQTFYPPAGMEVLDVSYVTPDPANPIGYRSIPMKGQSPIAIGNGSIAQGTTSELIGYNLPGTNGNGFVTQPVTGAGKDRGTLAGVYADTGIFFSTDPRTAYASYTGAAMTNNSGDTVGELYAANVANAVVRDIRGSMTLWDSYQLRAYGRKDVAPIIDDGDGRGNAPWGLASAVAGPQSGYAWEFNHATYLATPGSHAQKMQAAIAIGPWNRIKYPGSQMSQDQPGLISNTLGQVGVDASFVGVDTTAVPPNATAVRFAIGQLELGRPEYSAVKVRVNSELATGCNPIYSDAFGGDAGGTDGGKDHIWRYFDPTIVSLNPCTSLQKVASKALVSPGEVFYYDITFINKGTVDLPNFTITDVLPSGINHVSATPTPNTISGQTIVWNFGTVQAGDVVTIRQFVRATGQGTLINTATARTGTTVVNVAQETVEVGNRAILLKSKTVNVSTSAPDRTVIYTIEIENIGTGKNGTPMVVRDILPPNFVYNSFVSATLNGATISSPTIVINASNPSAPFFTVSQGIDPGKKLFVTFVAYIPPSVQPGTYWNNFQVEYENKIIPPIPEAPVTIGSAKIGDTVYYDWDGDGTQDAGENGIPNVTVQLFASNGTTLLQTTTTDSSGTYFFTGLNEGTYVVKVTQPANTTQTADPDATINNQHTVVLAVEQQYLIADFGYQPTGTGSIGDRVFEDVNNNGTFNVGTDIGIPGVDVLLYVDTNGNGILDIATDILIDTATTNASGIYSITGLALGFDYLAVVDSGDTSLATYFGVDPVDATTPNPQPIDNLSGAYLNADFGYWRVAPGSIGDTVYADNNGNGIYEPLIDTPLGGVTVNLIRDNAIFLTAVTAPDGTYLFENLGPDSYTVEVDPLSTGIPAGYLPSVPDYIVNLSAGQNFLDADFPYSPVISKAVDLAFANPGDTLTYTVNLNSQTGELLNNVTVTDNVPLGTTLSSIGQGGSVDNGITENTPGINGSHPGTPGSGSVTLTAIKDTGINGDAVTLNYGSSTTLIENRGGGDTLGTRQILVQFDLSSVPAGATITGAEFKMTKSDALNPNVAFQIYPLLKSWTEGTGGAAGAAGAASFNQRIAGTFWGGGTTPFDVTSPSADFGSLLAQTTVNGAGTYTWSAAALLSQVQSWYATPANNFGLVMGSNQSGTDNTTWNSRENAGTKPQLVVNYNSTPTPATTTAITVSPDSVIDTGAGVQATVSMTVTATGAVSNIVPTALTVIPGPNGATASLVSGPTNSPASIGVGGGSAVFTWVYNFTAGTQANEVFFTGSATATGATFNSATSHGVIVSEPAPPSALITWNLGTNIAAVPGSHPGVSGSVSTTITSTKATYNYEDQTTRNYGADPVLAVEPDPNFRCRSFIEFDLSSIPAGATITSATLRLVHSPLADSTGETEGGDPFSIGIRRVTRAWVEGTAANAAQAGSLTWTSAGPANWTLAGGDFSATDYGSFTGGAADAPGTIYSVNVQTLVNEWYLGTQSNTGLALVPLTDTGGDDFFNMYGDEATLATNRPQLLVNYTPAALPSTTTALAVNRTLVGDGAQATVTMTVTASGAVSNIVPSALTVIPGANGSTASLVSGPTNSPASIGVGGGSATFTWVYSFTDGSAPDQVRFSGSATGTGATFGSATSHGVIVSPPLTFQVTVNNPPPVSGKITNVATVTIDGTPTTSNEVITYTSGTIGDFVWADLDSDGTQDVGEFGIAGVTMQLYAADGVTLLDTVVTDFAGEYRFVNVPAGSYVVTYDTGSVPGDYFATTPVTLPITIISGEQYNDADFGLNELPPGTGLIGDFVWLDADSDGVQDVGELGIANATVGLERFINSAWVVIGSTVTDANGAYNFTGLSAGDYRVTVDSNSQITSPYAQGTFALGSVTAPTYDVDGTGTPNVSLVTLATNSTVITTTDFGYNWSGSIGDFVWWDYDTDGLQDESPLVGIENARVQLYFDHDFDGVFDRIAGDEEILRVFTDANGAYVIPNLPPGNYFVDVYEDSITTGGVRNIVPTTDDLVPVNLTTGNMDVDTADFGYFEGARVEALVFWDVNGNGIVDPAEQLLANVTVTLTGEDLLGNPITIVKQSSSSGYVAFLVPEGIYTISYDPAEVETEYPGLGTTTTPFSFDFQAEVGEDGVRFFEFGVDNTGAIGDTIFIDVDGDGTRDPGDAGIADVTVNLILDVDGNGVIDFNAGDLLLDTQLTDANGEYLFTGLEDTDGTSRYITQVVTATLPDGLQEIPTAYPPGANVANSFYSTELLNGQSIDIVDFGYPLVPDVFLTVSGTIYHDNGNGGGSTGDGTQNGTEPGLLGVLVLFQIDVDGDTIFDQNYVLPTDSSGFYSFSGVPEGADVRVTVLEITLPNAAFVLTGDPNGAPLSNVYEINDVLANVADVDFGYLETLGTIAGTVVIGNGNGIADLGETAVDGVTVTLTYAGDDGILGTLDDVITTDITDVNGDYSFVNLLPGPYDITTDIPVTLLPLADADGGNPNNITLTLAVGDDITNRDFEYQTGSSISGIVWNDSDADGVRELGEPFFDGIVVYLDLDQDGTFDVGEPTTTTNVSGFYEFTELDTAIYQVRIDPSSLPADVIRSFDFDGIGTPELGVVNLPPNTNFDDGDFGYFFNGSIAGVITNDTTGDSFGDIPLEGVVVSLLYPGGSPVLDGNGDPITTTTNVTGAYIFNNVPPGNYIVSHVPPVGLFAKVDIDGGSLTTNGDITPIAVISGQDVTGQDFVDSDFGTISGSVGHDADLDSGTKALPIAGVLLTLKDELGNDIDSDPNTVGIQPTTTTTALDGTYSFVDVKSGTYTVVETQPAGYSSLSDVDGGNLDIIGDVTPITLLPGGNVTNQDFVELLNGTISGSVLADSDDDGDGDFGIAGVTVALVNSINDITITTTTNSLGQYSFANVAPGTYTVVETQPAGYSSVSDVDGGNLDIIGDVTPITLPPGGTVSNLDFVEILNVNISGIVLDDTDGNGTGDTGIGGVLITLLDESNNVVTTTTTLPDGSFEFPNLPPGTYTVVETDPPDYSSLTPNSVTVTLAPGSSAYVPFTDAQNGTISGSVGHDADLDSGTKALPIAGVLLTLKDALGNDIDSDPNTVGIQPTTTTTASDGSYSFENVSPGNYIVVETQPAGYSSLSDVDGGNLDIIGDVTPITLLPGADLINQDFVELLNANINGIVLDDTDGNGIGDTAIGGVLITLLDESNNVVTTTTTLPDGSFEFPNLPPGTYTVVETDPPDYISLTPNSVTVTLTPGGSAYVPFTDAQFASITGNVFNDTNRLTDNTVNGTGTNAGGIYINLVNPVGNLVVASLPVTLAGTYLFDSGDGVEINTNYLLILTPTVQTVGSVLTTSSLPLPWISVGENLGAGVGSDGTINGILAVSTTVGALSQANFGIVEVPDVTPIITAIPNVMTGPTLFNTIVRVNELNSVNTEGLITVRIPKDLRWTRSEAYNPALTSLNAIPLENSKWTYSENLTHHIFQTTDVIPSGQFSTFGFRCAWNSGQTTGIFTMTSQIDSGSGNENRIDNNADAEKLDYFIN